MTKLIAAYGSRLIREPDSTAVPVVELDASSYRNKRHNIDVDVPVFKIVQWIEPAKPAQSTENELDDALPW